MGPPWLPVALAFGALATVLASWGRYLARIREGTVQARPVGALALQCAGVLCGGAALGLGEGAAVVVPSLVAIGMGLFFLWLYSQRAVPAGDLRVEVGGRLRPFSVRDHTGARFDSSALAGQRVLLKFFRGGW